MTDDLGNALYKRNKTYFPNVNTGAGNLGFQLAPGVAEGRARMNQISGTSNYADRRTGGTMVNSPQGGSMFVPAGKLQSYLDKGYTLNTPPRTPLQNFDLTQAYNTGYGAPSPTTQQGSGGPYQVAGGVMKPIQTSLFPNIFATPAASAIGNFAGGNIQGAFTGMRNAINQANSFFSGNRQPQPPYGGGYAAGPRRYFDY